MRQTGGHGQYGHVWHRDRARPSAAPGFVFENDIVGGVIPKEFIPSIEKGIREAHEPRRARRLPDGRRARSRCSTAATTRWTRRARRSRSPASMAFQDGAKQAGIHLLEPVMAVEVVVPENYMGDVIGDFNTRRGRILGMASGANTR